MAYNRNDMTPAELLVVRADKIFMDAMHKHLELYKLTSRPSENSATSVMEEYANWTNLTPNYTVKDVEEIRELIETLGHELGSLIDYKVRQAIEALGVRITAPKHELRAAAQRLTATSLDSLKFNIVVNAPLSVGDPAGLIPGWISYRIVLDVYETPKPIEDYNTIINSVGVGCESPVQGRSEHHGHFTDPEYKDYLAAKQEEINRRIDAKNAFESSNPGLPYFYPISPDDIPTEKSEREYRIREDFSKRNADLKDYIQPSVPKIPLMSLLQQVNKDPKVQDAERELYRETFRSIAAAHDSDGFYARVPQLGRAEGFVISERDRLLQIIRQLTNLLAKR